MYFQLHSIRQQSSRNKSARKLIKLLLFSKKKKDKQNKKPKQVKALATPVCKKANKNKRTGKGVSIIWFLVHATFPNYDLFMRVSKQFISFIRIIF